MDSSWYYWGQKTFNLSHLLLLWYLWSVVFSSEAVPSLNGPIGWVNCDGDDISMLKCQKTNTQPNHIIRDKCAKGLSLRPWSWKCPNLLFDKNSNRQLLESTKFVRIHVIPPNLIEIHPPACKEMNMWASNVHSGKKKGTQKRCLGVLGNVKLISYYLHLPVERCQMVPFSGVHSPSLRVWFDTPTGRWWYIDFNSKPISISIQAEN